LRAFAAPKSCVTLVSLRNSEGAVLMSLQAHLAELERKHQALEREIEAERLHPAVDDLKLVELKRKKLLLKDEIEKIRRETVAVTKH
jgi:hypothetical protein